FSPQQRQQLIEGTLAAQFATISEAAKGCDVVVGSGALQVAAPSIAEKAGIRYVHVQYCPVTLPSSHHAPPALPGWARDDTASNGELWAVDAQRWNDSWGAALNAHRASIGLAPVDDVRSHILTDRPWLASDPTLSPWPEPEDTHVFQTGAWILPDERSLPAKLEDFLDAGDPPVYFGLGSMAAPAEGVGGVMLDVARSLGRRAVISRGWADLALPGGASDSILIGEVNHQALFQRVIAVVHHGGAGTASTAARAGVAQVVIPQRYDQPYWAQRVRDLGIGVAHTLGMPTAESLATALGPALEPAVTTRARSIAGAVRTDGAEFAAQQLAAPATGSRGWGNS
ncbi:MAG: glycosyltransferase family 1 protein, partial [Candidatus Dormibacteraeota bacterium]|nr:glycosyltransferase family 1 protein [Candidatus Dormibacteraeota bacterium]